MRLRDEGESARGIAGLRVIEEIIAVLAAELDVVAAEDLGDRTRELVHAFLPIHDPVSLRCRCRCSLPERWSGTPEGRLIPHVLRETECGQIERLDHRFAEEVGVGQSVTDGPEVVGALHAGELSHDRVVYVRLVRAVVERVGGVAFAEQVRRVACAAA